MYMYTLVMNVIVMEREASHFGDVYIKRRLFFVYIELVFCYMTVVLGGATVLLSVSSLCR